MLAWMIENKEWLFSGVLVAVPTAIVGWICSRRNKGPSSNPVQQHSGSGDNVGRDKNVNG